MKKLLKKQVVTDEIKLTVYAVEGKTNTANNCAGKLNSGEKCASKTNENNKCS